MKLLLTNDDGINHPGIRTMFKFLKEKFDVVALCPNRNWSSKGCAMTIFDAIKMYKVDEDIYAINGSPVDAIVLGIEMFKPDAVIVGPNPHPTVATDIFRSATLATAIQARFLGVPAAAISIYSDNIKTSFEQEGDPSDYLLACEVAEWLLKRPWFNMNVTWNVNVSSGAKSVDDVLITRCAVVDFGDKFVEIGKDCRGERWFRITYEDRIDSDEDVGYITDIAALRRKKISLTPLLLDMTNYTVVDHFGYGKLNVKKRAIEKV